MKLQELRVGNLFMDSDNTYCYFAGCWNRNDGWICRDSAGNTYKEAEMYPIPLTPEVLQKCGFDKAAFYNEVFFIGYHGYCLDFDGKDWCLKMRCDEPYIVAYSRYLHQLQNLYFAIVGEELIYTSL